MLKALTRIEAAAWMVPAVLLLTYGGIPLVLYLAVGDASALECAQITLVGCVAFLFGWHCRIAPRLYLVSVEGPTLVWAIWLPFILFALLAWVTAERIPLLAALQGAGPAEVAVYRERFLKAREGWQHAFVYVNALLTSALVPYSLALLFHVRAKGKWLFFLFFCLYCVSFLEKAYFFRALVPLFFLAAQRRIRIPLRPAHQLLLGLSLLMAVTFASGSGTDLDDLGQGFWSSGFAPQGALQLLLWRSFAIPVVTALDALRTFHQTFGGRYFHGATSSVFVLLFGMKPVAFEQAVFMAQWGQNETATGSSNAVYLVEAFVNWGLAGVVAVSFALGALFRLFRDALDPCLQALWLLLLFAVYTSGFIGTLLSNGYFLLLGLVFFVRLRPPGAHPATP